VAYIAGRATRHSGGCFCAVLPSGSGLSGVRGFQRHGKFASRICSWMLSHVVSGPLQRPSLDPASTLRPTTCARRARQLCSTCAGHNFDHWLVRTFCWPRPFGDAEGLFRQRRYCLALQGSQPCLRHFRGLLSAAFRIALVLIIVVRFVSCTACWT